MPGPTRPTPRQLVKALAACSVVSFWAAGTDVHAQALPTGMIPVAGQVSARVSGSAMTVTNSPNAIINWNSFSIGAANSVRFNQANASSQVLNRVTGNDPSSILGSLSSNGRVWLLNQNGVLFGRGARVDVAGLVASTLNLTDTDWLTGRLQFASGGAKAADIVNLGELRSTLGGQIALLGGSVRNEGVIDAPGGQVLLAAGSSIELVDSMTPNVSVKLGTTPGEAVNLGRLSAAGGRVDIEAGIVNQDGIVRADAVERGPGGEVVLRARDQLNLGAASQTSANGDSGGKITLEADQTTVRGAVSATGSQAAGGQVQLLGRLVGVLDAARVDVSGIAGGGEVLVGGGQQGKDPSVPNAQAVYFGPQAGIAADAIESGDGGRVILWSDQATRAYGSLSARGGPLGGNGGLVETSGGWLDSRPSRLDLSAPHGKGGQWLLDPFDITINDAGPDVGYDPVSFTANANGSTISTAVIKGELEVGNSVTISTGGGTGGQAGNITMANASLLVNSSGPGDLTLIADGNISMISSTIQSQFGPMNVSLQAGRGGDGGISLLNSSIVSANGNITLGGFGLNNTGISGGYCIPPAGGCFAYSYPFPNNNVAHSSTNPGVQLANSTLNAGTGSLGGGGGTLSIAGDSGALNGVEFVSSTLGAETIQIRGSSANSSGVLVSSTNMTTTRDLSIQGVGGQNGVVVDTNSSLVSSFGTSGNFSLSLVGASTTNFSGVLVDGTLTGGNGNSVSVIASNVGGGSPTLWLRNAHVSANSAPGSLSLGIIDPSIVGNDILIDGATLVGSPAGIQMLGASTLTLRDTTSTGRGYQLQADNIDFEGATSLASNQISGDVFVLSNKYGVGPLISFTNNSTVVLPDGSSGALQTSGSPARWIIWDADITSSAFSPGALPYDFTMYAAASPSAWSATAGNGYVSAAPGVATVVGTINPRVYDTTVSVPLQGSLQATGPRGEVAVFGSPPGLQYADKNVGIAKPVELFGSYTVSFSDSLGKPAYGMTLQSGMTGDITPATIPLQGLSGNTKVYDSTNAATYSGTASVTPLGSDNVTVSIPIGAPAFFADKNVGNGKAITIPSMSLTGVDAANYLLNTSSLTANILPFQLSLSGVTVNNKVYDTTVNATLNGTPGANFFAGDSIALTGGTALFIDKNAGTNKPVRVSGFGLSGTDAGNYIAPPTTLLTADITPATLVLNGLSAANKVYDATTSATLSGSASVTPLSGDFVGLAGTPVGSFADKNVGSAKPVAVGGLSLTGNDSPNYVLAAPASLTADITPALVSVQGLTGNTKTYDATLAATYSGTPSVTPLGSDSLAVSLPNGAPAFFVDKNVGNGKPITIPSMSLTGVDAGNYVLVPFGLSGRILPFQLTLSGVSVNNKVYDGTTAATVTGTPSINIFPGDSLSPLSIVTAFFSTKNAGTGRIVQVIPSNLTGADAGNYTLDFASTLLRADITPATLVLNGLSAANKVYDATTSATLNGSASVTPLSGDVVGLVGTPVGNFADKNVGTAKPVAVGGLSLSGNDAPNYVLAAPAGLAADITPATLVVSGLVANNKIYDATTLATLSGSASVTPLGEDLVSVSGTPTGTFADKNVGTAKSVSISAGILTGPDAANYIPVTSAALSANITPASLAVSGLVANNKVYDATTLATLSGTASVSPLGSDSVSVSGTPVGAFSDPNVGTAKRVAVSGVTLSGADAGNYAAVVTAPLSADITPATLRYVAAPAVSSVGQAPPPLGGTVAGFLGTDTLASSTSGTLAFTTSVTSLSPAGFYPIFGQGLLALNYVFVQDPANATAMSVGTGQLVPVAQSSDVLIANTVESVTEPPMMTKLGAGGLLDLTTQPAPTRTTASGSASAGGGGGGGGLGLPIGSAQPTAFDPVDLASQSQDELQEMLATRDRFKQELFAEATSKLERDPKLADVPACQTLKEIDLGKCLLTDSLKREWLASAPTAGRQTSAGSAAGASSGAPPGPTAAAPARPADSGVAPGQQAAAPAAAAVPEAVLTLPAVKRHVVTAALPQIDRKVALVIGVDNYDDPSIPHLANSVKDARAVGHMLESQLGYETIVLENPNKKTVITALNRFALELKSNDSMVIYYAGHGDVVEATKLGYWQLADSDAKHPESWLSNADIGRLIGQLGASQVALISDSCYSGSLVSEVRIRAATGAVDPAQVLAGRSVVVMSSGGNEPVFDEGKDGHSPFAWNLMNTLGNLSNWQAGGHVFERVRFGVARELPQRPQYGAYIAGGQQYNGGDYLFEQRQLELNPH